MKNIFKITLIAAVAAFAFTSCSKEDNPAAAQKDTVLDLTINYAGFGGTDTKATKKGWENGDLVYMVFKKSGDSEYDFKNYVKVEYNGSKWILRAGQTVLNNLPDGTGVVSACHHTGISDPTLNTEGTANNFPGNYLACFGMLGKGISYAKTEGKITATIKFIQTDRFQFNIKGLDFVEGKYCLNIYKESQEVLGNSFGRFALSGGQGVTKYAGDCDNIPAKIGYNNSADREISFFVSFWDAQLSGFYTTTGGIYTYTFDPTFVLTIKINSTNYYAQRTITGKSYTAYKAYSLNGPTATDAQIQAASAGDDLGNGWTLK